MAAAVSGTGLRGEVAQITVDLHDLTAKEMIAWRMGMPQLAPYLSPTTAHERVRLRAIDLLAARRRCAARRRVRRNGLSRHRPAAPRRTRGRPAVSPRVRGHRLLVAA